MNKLVQYACLPLDVLPYDDPLRLLGMMHRCPMPVDRTGRWNQLRTAYKPMCADYSNSKSLKENCLARAEELWNLKQPIVLFWSGGIDSTLAFLALRETIPDDAEFSVRYTVQSVEEYPNFIPQLSSWGNQVEPKDLLIPELFTGKNNIVVTGEAGDQVAGSDILELLMSPDNPHPSNWDDDWHTILKWDKLLRSNVMPAELVAKFNTKKNHQRVHDVCEDLCSLSPFPVKTVFDMFSWTNSCIKWHWVTLRMNFNFARTPHYKSTYAFYDTHEFEKWSIANHHRAHTGTYKSYKQPMKDLINEFHKDEDYRVNKPKIPSLVTAVPLKNISMRDADSLSLVLEDERCWRYSDKIPEDLLDSLILNSSNE